MCVLVVSTVCAVDSCVLLMPTLRVHRSIFILMLIILHILSHSFAFLTFTITHTLWYESNDLMLFKWIGGVHWKRNREKKSDWMMKMMMMMMITLWCSCLTITNIPLATFFIDKTLTNFTESCKIFFQSTFLWILSKVVRHRNILTYINLSFSVSICITFVCEHRRHLWFGWSFHNVILFRLKQTSIWMCTNRSCLQLRHSLLGADLRAHTQCGPVLCICNWCKECVPLRTLHWVRVRVRLR